MPSAVTLGPLDERGHPTFVRFWDIYTVDLVYPRSIYGNDVPIWTTTKKGPVHVDIRGTHPKCFYVHLEIKGTVLKKRIHPDSFEELVEEIAEEIKNYYHQEAAWLSTFSRVPL